MRRVKNVTTVDCLVFIFEANIILIIEKHWLKDKF